MVSDPAMQALRSQPAAIDAVYSASSYADDSAIPNCDVHRTTVGTKSASGLYPALRFLENALIDSLGPVAKVRGSRTPDVGNTVTRLTDRGGFVHVAHAIRNEAMSIRPRSTL